MNNDEMKIPAEDINDVESEKPVADQPTEEAKAQKGSWWSNLTFGFKMAIISAVPVIVIAAILLVVLLSGGKSNQGGGSGNQGGGNQNGGGQQQNASYSVSIVTKGGMPMAGLPVYIYEYDDGDLGDLVDGGYAATDANGKATFNLPVGGSYAAKIDGSIPKGYDVASHYPLVSGNLDIIVSSAVIPESDISGVYYTTGDIIRDFTATTTDGKKFTLSEVLKEKDAVLINFWYTTCSWCIEEFPLMQSAYEKYKDDIAIIALDPYQDDTLIDITTFKSQYGLTFDVAQDFTGLSVAFGVTGYPTSVMIDRYGMISMIVPGAITSQRAFDLVFDHFTGDEYDQKILVDYNDIVPQEKPTESMPSSDEISDVLDGGSIDGIEYLPYPEDAKESEIEYSWPFVIDEFRGETVVHPSNVNKEGSFAQLVIKVPLNAGEALAFDYFSSTELGADILYVIVDKKDIYSISGPFDTSASKESQEESAKNNTWKTCFAYVAEETATYELALVYQKDTSENLGDDTVYLKNLRKVAVEEINVPTYIFRFAATNPDDYSNYQDYVEIFYNEKDGYYHVDSVDGPLLLANLMGYTRFSEDNYVYNMALGTAYEAAMTTYCNYASNSQINGVCPVTEELMNLLKRVALDNYGDPNNDKEWLEFCCYYDSYGTDDELVDPIKGLTTFSAYETVLSTDPLKRDENGNIILDTENYPNSVTYNRVIMPRGLFSKFTPTESGVYLISSVAPGTTAGTYIDCEAWIFKSGDFNTKNIWYTYNNIDRFNVGYTGDMSNVYMISYLEAGVDYYINIAYGDVYQTGTISFRIDRLGDEGSYRFSLASPGFFTSLENEQGVLTETVSGGIKLVLGADGIWREDRTDGREGSIIYADFTRPTGIFDFSIEELIKKNAFNLATNENDEYMLALMRSNQAYTFYLNLYLKELWGAAYDAKYEEYKVDEVLKGTYHGEKDASGKPTKSENDKFILEIFEGMSENKEYNNFENLKKFLESYWGDSYLEHYEEYKVEDVVAGIYHGNGHDYTAEISAYLDKVITVGYNEQLGLTIEEGDERIGCVIVDKELSELLQVIMDKYTFEGVEYSWAKLCYYHQYFGPATPN